VSTDFHDLLEELVACQVRFVVVGAHALAAHGVPRATGDLDILVEPSEENATRIWEALARFGAPLSTLTVKREDFVHPDQVIQFGLPPYRIDILTSISGVSFDEASEGAIRGSLFDVPVTFIGRDAFIRNKRATGRPKDLEDVRFLER
jgi:hypothetical protein